MEHSTSYERIIPLRAVGAMRLRRILLIASYLLIGIGGVLWVLRSMNPYVLLLTLLGLGIWILLTKNFLYIEYEYSFFGGRFSLSKIYGKRSRRLIAEFDSEQLLLVDYDSEEGQRSAQRYRPSTTVSALSSPKLASALLLLWEEEDKTRHLVRVESDERLEQLLRRANPRACSYAFKRGQR
ncbi:MAG: hypothetical protein E7668_04690 [Ruminococcaceae bacterium]|nr:hypothetical protein [Oscillospiraceae bacterium]